MGWKNIAKYYNINENDIFIRDTSVKLLNRTTDEFYKIIPIIYIMNYAFTIDGYELAALPKRYSGRNTLITPDRMIKNVPTSSEYAQYVYGNFDKTRLELMNDIFNNFDRMKFKELYDTPDELSNDLHVVYMVTEYEFRKTSCEKLGYPNKDIDGHIMYNDSYITDFVEAKKIYENLLIEKIKSYNESIKSYRDRIRLDNSLLITCEEDLSRINEQVQKINSLEP